MEGGGLQELNKEIKQLLAEKYGFDLKWKQVWEDGCSMAKLHEELLSGSFVPAKGNALLIGDAAGLALPVAYEGIGTAIKSGILAAASIAKAMETGNEAGKYYIHELREILGEIKRLHPLEDWLVEQATKGDETLLDAFKEACEEALIKPVY